MQNSLLFSALLASIITFIAIYLLRPFAISINLLDSPNSRKKHTGSVPLIGGIAMFIGITGSILVLSNDLNQFKYFLLSSSIIVIIGILDDHRDISVSLRLLFQMLVAIIVTSVGGLSIESLGNLFGNSEIFLSEWAFFFSVIAIMMGMNAVNMADGIHGLAGGNSLITFVAILYLSKDSLSMQNLLLVILFCSVLPVFLINNLCIGVAQRNRIFMGDAGSMFIGLGIVWVLIDFSQGQSEIFSPVTALWLFAVPLIEMITAILRRIASGNSPFKADLYHSHHILLKLGFREKITLLIILSASILFALIGILGEIYNVAESTMLIGFLLIFGIYVILNRIGLNRIK